MLLYLDTSALVKLYLQEDSSEQVIRYFEQASAIASHQIAFIEFHAALARRHREGDIRNQDFDTIKQNFAQHWADYLQIQTDQALLNSAAELAEAFALRAYDSVHLAAAQYLHKNSKASVHFACFDKRLNLAAKMLGMALLD